MKSRLIFYILAPLLLMSCGDAFKQKEEMIKIVKTDKTKDQTDTKRDLGFTGVPTSPISVTASGNADVNVTIAEKKPVKLNEKTDSKETKTVESSFSVDYYLKSIPLLGWVLILLCFLGLIIAVWIFIKTTMAGKAFDASISKGLELTEDAIDRCRDKLAIANKSSDLHTELLTELSRLKGEKGDYLHDQKRK